MDLRTKPKHSAVTVETPESEALQKELKRERNKRRFRKLLRSTVSALGGILFAKIYLKEYIAITNMNKQTILRWIPIRAATYIDVGLPVHLEKIFQRIVKKHYQ